MPNQVLVTSKDSIQVDYLVVGQLFRVHPEGGLYRKVDEQTAIDINDSHEPICLQVGVFKKESIHVYPVIQKVIN